jgi:colanic acid biosynthesis glycosyl transferase WcaI
MRFHLDKAKITTWGVGLAGVKPRPKSHASELRSTALIQNKAASLNRSVASTGRPNGRCRVLIHGINYAPEPIGVGRYTGDFAEYLAEQGHSVEVVTAVPHYPGWWVRPPFRNYRYWSETRSGVKVIRCPLLLHRGGKGLWRLLMPLTFALAAAPVVFWRILRSRPDTVICIEPTLLSAPAAIVAAKIVGARRALHVHDLEVDAAFAVGHLRTGSLQRLAEAVGSFLIRRFDVIITLSQRMRERLAAKKPQAARLEVIRNWVDTSKIRPLRGPNRFRRELGLSDTDFVVLYAGQIGPKQSLHLLFEAAEQLIGNARLRFVIAGDGPLKKDFLARYGHLANVHFLPLQPEEALCELLNLADLHLLPQSRGASDLVLPSKLGGLLATERPILVTADEGTELHYILKDVAIIVPPEDTAALASGILTATVWQPDISRIREVVRHFSRDRNLPELTKAILF